VKRREEALCEQRPYGEGWEEWEEWEEWEKEN
jgi:hypothetical protein